MEFSCAKEMPLDWPSRTRASAELAFVEAATDSKASKQFIDEGECVGFSILRRNWIMGWL